MLRLRYFNIYLERRKLKLGSLKVLPQCPAHSENSIHACRIKDHKSGSLLCLLSFPSLIISKFENIRTTFDLISFTHQLKTLSAIIHR